MAVIPILTWPNPVLMKKAEPVTTFDEALAQLVRDMVDTMYDAPGVGLAAPQVGVSKALYVVAAEAWVEDEADLDPAIHKTVAFINPVILEGEGEATMDEGCLSFPDIYVPVKRPARVKVRAQDVTGAFFEMWTEGLGARAVQHELDHLEGVLLTDRVGRLKREFIKKKMRKAHAAGATAR